MTVKPAITQQEKVFIGGWYISIWFYSSTREAVPTGKDLIRMNMDGLTDEELNHFVEAAEECGRALMATAGKTTELFESILPALLPDEDDRLDMIKKMACRLGLDVVADNLDIKISDSVSDFASQMMIHALWEDTNPTEEVIAAIWLEAVGLALTAPKTWEIAENSELRAHVEELINTRFLVMDPPVKGKYTVQYPS